MKISSIATEIGAFSHPATSTKRADLTTGGPAVSADTAATAQLEQLVNAAALGTPKAASNPGEAGAVITPVINEFKFLLQGLKFSADEETGREIIKVVDIKSGRIIRQIPSEEALNLLRHLQEHKGAVLSIKS
jgi:flagellar protein FlaG